VNDDYLDRLSRQIAGLFRGRVPADPGTVTAIESVVTRVRRAMDRVDSAPHPGPQYPQLPPISFSDSDAEQLMRLVLSRLP
jgi:hypothetical protein